MKSLSLSHSMGTQIFKRKFCHLLASRHMLTSSEHNKAHLLPSFSIQPPQLWQTRYWNTQHLHHTSSYLPLHFCSPEELKGNKAGQQPSGCIQGPTKDSWDLTKLLLLLGVKCLFFQNSSQLHVHLYAMHPQSLLEHRICCITLTTDPTAMASALQIEEKLTQQT